MAENDDNTVEGWHLDKRIPITLIIAIVLQTVAVVWWGARLDQRVTQLELTSSSRAEFSDRITRQETLMESVQDTTRRIETKVDRILDDERH